MKNYLSDEVKKKISGYTRARLLKIIIPIVERDIKANEKNTAQPQLN